MKKKLLFITSLLIILLSKNGFATAEIPSTEDLNLITHRAAGDQDNSIILSRDFSFNIPLVKLVNNKGVTSYYDVDFIFLPENSKNNKLLFGVTKGIEIERSRINTLDVSNAIILNRDLSFNIPSIRYVDVDDSIKYYNADFIYTPINNKLIFEVAKVVEIQAANTSRCEYAKKDCHVKLEDNSAILGLWHMNAEAAALNKETLLVDNTWEFREDGILLVESLDPSLDNIEKVKIKYSIEDGSIRKQITPERERYETCSVLKLEDKEMIMHCKYLYYFFTK